MKTEEKIRIAHLRRKRQKTTQEELTHPDEYVYDELQTQEETTEEVVNYYIDLRHAQTIKKMLTPSTLVQLSSFLSLS